MKKKTLKIKVEGIPGKTPEKGVEYFTAEDQAELVSQIMSQIVIPEPIPGKDAVVDYVKLESFITEKVSKIQIPEPIPGKDAVVDYNSIIVQVLAQIPEVDIEPIKEELKKYIESIQPKHRVLNSGGPTTRLGELVDVNIEGATAGQVLKFDGSNWVPGTDSDAQNLQEVTDNGSTTTNSITAQSFITTGGTSSDYVKGDGSLGSVDLSGYVPYTGATSNLNLGAYSLKLNQIFDSSDVTSIDPNQRKLHANNGSEVLNYSDPSVIVMGPQLTVGSIYPPSGSLFIGSASLQDSAFQTSLDSSARTLNDLSGAIVVAWGNGTYALNATGDSMFSGDIEANTITKTGGLSTEFLKADGSVDSSTYATTGDLSAYVPYANATQITANLGTVSAPIYSFTGDTNTGMWSPTADTLAWSTGGTERVRIDSTGKTVIGVSNFAVDITNSRVGIGTSTPAYPLHLTSDLTQTGSSSYFNGYFYTETKPTANTAGTFVNTYYQITSRNSFNYTGSVNGMQFIVSHQGTGTMNQLRGVLGSVGTEVSATNSITTAIGASYGVNHNGSGTITNAFAENNSINNSGGTMTTGIVFYANTPAGTSAIANFYAFRTQNFARSGVTNAWGFQSRNTTGGTNQVGVGIGSVTGGTKNTHLLIGTETIPTGSWGIYNVDTNANYFAGSIGILTTSANSSLHVNGSFATAYRAITALRTLDATDYLIDCTANSFTVTLPTAVGITGRKYIVFNSGTGTISFATTSSQTVNGASPVTLSIAQWEEYSFISNGANWYITA